MDELTEEQLREARHQQRLAKRPILQYARRESTISLKIEDFDQEELRDLILGLWGSLNFADQKDLVAEFQWYLIRNEQLPAISLAISMGMRGSGRLA